MRRRTHGIRSLALAGGLILAAGGASAQNMQVDPGSVSVGEGLPSWVALEMMGEDSPHVRRYRALQGEQRELRQELRRLRTEFFRSGNTELRQIGISRLRTYTDPAAYPVLLEVFEREPLKVRTAILDMLADQETADADTTLAWVALFEDDEAYREAALRRLERRVDAIGEVPDRVAYLASQALRKRSDRDVAAAARVAESLNIVRVIPHLINAQVSGAQAGGGGEQGGALGWILVGRQVAFVEDLQPIVADSAVAFDPQLNVISEGVVVRALGASVVTYRTVVNTALTGLASRAVGRDLSHLGWDQRAWWDWYERELKPLIEDRGVADVRRAAMEAEDQSSADETPAGG